MEGSLSEWISTIEKELVKARAFCEASFEFIDEDMTFDKQISSIISNTLQTITLIKKTFDQQQHIRQGIRVAIIGTVNTGKSSLFNALLAKERAIVTNIAGTTRDVIEAGLYKNGSYWTLIDTAGLRHTNNVIEKEGIRRSFDEGKKADIILLVFDGSQQLAAEDQMVYHNIIKQYDTKIMVIRNKSDMPQQQHTIKEDIVISSKNKININKLEKKIQEKIDHLLSLAESPFLLNQRQFNLLLGLEKKLTELQSMLKDNIQYELVSYHLNDALAHLSDLTGKSISEKTMDAVFQEFCVGK